MGNIGIGTSSPSARLHIRNGNSSNTAHADADELLLENNDNVGLSMLFDNTNDRTASIFMGTQGNNSIGVIQYKHNIIGASRLMTFDAGDGNFYFKDGNVGIGTTTPNSKLEVNGDIKAGGQIFIDGNGFFKPKSSDDASAPNNSIYFSTTQNKLVYKTGGTVYPLH